jgi:hypothetical protein
MTAPQERTATKTQMKEVVRFMTCKSPKEGGGHSGFFHHPCHGGILTVCTRAASQLKGMVIDSACSEDVEYIGRGQFSMYSACSFISLALV